MDDQNIKLYNYKNQFDITFMIPCYNEEDNIHPTIIKLYKVISRIPYKCEVIIIDDCSNDNTSIIAKQCISSKNYPNLKLINNDRNMGLGFNYSEGAFAGNGEYYMLVNGDNPENEEYLINVINNLGKADMIIPNFVGKDNRKLKRLFLSKLFTLLVNIFSGYNIKYYNGTVLHKRYNVMRYHSGTNGFAYQAEIIVHLLNLKKTFVEVDVENNDHDVPSSNYSSTGFTIRNVLSVSNSLLQIIIRRIRKHIFGY